MRTVVALTRRCQRARNERLMKFTELPAEPSLFRRFSRVYMRIS